MQKPKPVVLLSSCKRDQENSFNEAVRQTWAKNSPIPVFFFVGDGAFAKQPDEVKLNVPDNYLALTFKSKESLAWAVRNGFTHVFRAFTDTFVDPLRLLNSRFHSYDYTGNQSELYADGYTFAHGGPGYWLGPRAIAVLLDSPIQLAKFDYHKFEDQWVGSVLHESKIFCRDDKRYSMGMSYKKAEPDSLPGNDVISTHLSMWTNQYNEDWMHQVHAARFENPYEAKIPRDPHQCNCRTCLLIKAKKDRLELAR